MSRIASRVSSVSASGSTLTKRPSAVSKVDTPSVGQQAVRRVVVPEGRRSWYSNSGTAVTVSLGLGPGRSVRGRAPRRRSAARTRRPRGGGRGSSTTRWARCACRSRPAGARRPSGPSRTSRSPGERVPPELIHALGFDQGGGGDGQRPPPGDPQGRRRGDPRRRVRDVVRRVRRPLPARRLPDRLRHEHQHERQRGAGPRGLRAPRPARAPQRRRQRLPVVERRVPVRASGWPPAG